MIRRSVALLVVALIVMLPAVASAQVPSPKVLTPFLASKPQGRMPNGLSYTVYVENGRAALRVSNGGASAAPESTFWVALFDAKRNLTNAFGFESPDLGPGESANAAIRTQEAWPRGGAAFFRVAYWDRILEVAPTMEPVVELVKPIKSGTLKHSTQAFDITFQVTSGGIAFELRNKSGKAIRIIWDESSFIDQSGRAHKVIRGGTRLIEKEPPPHTHCCPPGGGRERHLLPRQLRAVDGRRVG